jgi:glutamine synthetase adenylyltransferase
LTEVHAVFRRVFGDAETAPRAAPAKKAKADPAFAGYEHGEDAVSRAAEAAPHFAPLFARHRKDVTAALRDEGERDPKGDPFAAVKAAKSYGGQLGALRRAWAREIAVIAALDAAGLITIRESKDRQTALAEASIEAAVEIARREMERKFDAAIPRLALGVLAFGKLGGAGLDFDSDLDLALVYDAEAAPANITAAEFYSRAAEIFVNALSAITRDGSLYRVDMRLRPHGKDGPLATERGAFVEYMEREAALWELLAFVKVRAVGGDAAVAAETEAAVREAIHRRATETGAEAIAAETRRVRSELEKRKGRAGLDIKYGEGGLLDIYFAIRFLQLRDDIRDGGQGRSTEQTLERLRDAGSLASLSTRHSRRATGCSRPSTTHCGSPSAGRRGSRSRGPTPSPSSPPAQAMRTHLPSWPSLPIVAWRSERRLNRWSAIRGDPWGLLSLQERRT